MRLASKILLVMLSGLCFDCAQLLIQSMNPINTVAKAIYHWDQDQASLLYGVASSLPTLVSLAMMLYPTYWLLKTIGRLNSIRLALILVISGCSLQLIRHTAGMMMGRVVQGIANSIILFNSIPYIINCVTDENKYFYSSLAIIISRSDPLFHALTFLAIDPDRVEQNRIWIVTIMFPTFVAAAGLVISVFQRWDSPDSYFNMYKPTLQEFTAYYEGFLQEEQATNIYSNLKQKETDNVLDYTITQYMCKPVIRHKFWMANLMQVSRQWLGSSVFIIFLFFSLSRLQSPDIASTFNFIALALDILILTLTSVMFYFVNRVKLIWMTGNLLMVGFCLASGIVATLGNTSPIKYILVIQRPLFIMTIETVVFSYVPRILPPVGQGINYVFFFVTSYISSQTLVPMLDTSTQLPFFFYTGVGIIVVPVYILLMRQADQYEQIAVTTDPVIIQQPSQIVLDYSHDSLKV